MHKQTTEKSKYTIYWLDGKKTVLNTEKGNSVADAFTEAGYSNGATRAIDFYVNGTDDNYIWDSVKREWVKKPTDA